MDAIWDRIEAWLKVNAPAVLASLNPPASEADIAATEELIGRALPEDVKAAYRRHDGQAVGGGGALFDGWQWLPLEDVRREWGIWKELLDGGDFDGMENEASGHEVTRDWWNPGWVPVTASGGGDSHCVDLAPGRTGRVGQVIEMIHDDGPRPVIARNFAEWLDTFADELEAGDRAVHPESGYLMHKRYH